MKISHALSALALTFAFAATGARAQVCSGGADGGMDATGNQCNDPQSALAAPAPEPRTPYALRAAAMTAYEAGHYDRAAALLAGAADQGDVWSAETLAMMYRFGPSLYGAGFAADARLARYWSLRATEALLRERDAQ